MRVLLHFQFVWTFSWLAWFNSGSNHRCGQLIRPSSRTALTTGSRFAHALHGRTSRSRPSHVLSLLTPHYCWLIYRPVAKVTDTTACNQSRSNWGVIHGRKGNSEKWMSGRDNIEKNNQVAAQGIKLSTDGSESVAASPPDTNWEVRVSRLDRGQAGCDQQSPPKILGTWDGVAAVSSAASSVKHDHEVVDKSQNEGGTLTHCLLSVSLCSTRKACSRTLLQLPARRDA